MKTKKTNTKKGGQPNNAAVAKSKQILLTEKKGYYVSVNTRTIIEDNYFFNGKDAFKESEGCYGIVPRVFRTPQEAIAFLKQELIIRALADHYTIISENTTQVCRFSKVK